MKVKIAQPVLGRVKNSTLGTRQKRLQVPYTEESVTKLLALRHGAGRLPRVEHQEEASEHLKPTCSIRSHFARVIMQSAICTRLLDGHQHN
jgi:hypothetical protein